MANDEDIEEESTCGRPCDPQAPCDECDEYWQRMMHEGYWDNRRRQWTDKGWASITRI